MVGKLQQHIHQKFSFLKGKKLLIAISGGVDSVVLTHLFYQLNFDISLAHCNFHLRGEESGKDEEFVKELGKRLDLKTFSISFETEKYATKNQLSTQVAARNLRYDWFQELTKTHLFDFVITAHHADDNLETFLINLTRGTGLEGFTGIPEINNTIVRPFLIFSRDEIETYATENSINWREDKSNASNKYLRNKIRHQIVPILKEINPTLLESFQKTTEHLQESQQIIDASIADFKKKVVKKTETGNLKFDIAQLLETTNSKAYAYQLLKEFGFTEWNDVTHLLTAQSGKEVVSKTHRLLKDRGFLLLSEIKKTDKNTAYQIAENTLEITVPIHLTFEKIVKKTSESKTAIFVDLEKIIFPLVLRRWQHGDFFYPKGMQGKKKISKYFKDEKLSLIDKENTWLLCSNNDIIWIVEKRQDNRFITNNNTKKILKILLK
ncbi:tRNA(Ile)-lysidine synthase [Polaribacter huanghezhanensis]|uniref:tRNA lysidine(34) synthetase TilS n=1 Tax=Polaribacter huanghezhanensis TaxID=1354726 RepID=UPI002648A40C|nr:tRNA lysidine(34) synthetase TilS [Polaribacter huanghezhanensis]WKD85770.1 tRNA(Ile)-lysidine synthase [Polaribacter huanghezhanensis]